MDHICRSFFCTEKRRPLISEWSSRLSGQGIAFASRRSGKRRLRWPFLRRLGTSLTLRFDPHNILTNAKGTFFKVPLSFERTGDRTLDPQIKSLLLYQLSYPPDAKLCIAFFGFLRNTYKEIFCQPVQSHAHHLGKERKKTFYGPGVFRISAALEVVNHNLIALHGALYGIVP